MATDAVDYLATQTAELFHHDDSFVRGLIGPVGCGKSVACCMEILSRAIRQEPGKDGIRQSRWAIIRNTYPDLESTTMKTWASWFPEEKFGRIKHNSPITQLIKFNDVELEIMFLAMDKEKDIKKLMSLELTGIYINEMQYINQKIFKICLERLNRFPAKKEGALITFTGLIFDTNPPADDHWIFSTFEERKPKGYKLFKYDPPVIKVDKIPENEEYEVSLSGGIYVHNPNADYVNVQNDTKYWIKLIPGKTCDEIKVNIMGNYGVIVDGRPVHSTYNDSIHFINKEIPADRNFALGLGWDFGLSPACAIVQQNSRGQFIVIDELWSDYNDLRDFTENIVIPHLDKNYPFWRNNYISRHDPAGAVPSQTDGKACSDILEELGIISEVAAESNAPTPRRDGLKYFLARMAGGFPALVLSAKCKRIRKGLMGNFCYERKKSTTSEEYHDKPRKNIFSHICEALEYIAMYYSADNKSPPPKPKRARRIAGSFMAL